MEHGLLHSTDEKAGLKELIRREIVAGGPVSFAWFMEQALYHPEHGYYASGRAQIGREGDYFTNVSVGPVYGRLLSLQFGEIWRKLGGPREFTIVEQGAYNGQLARDVLAALQTHDPDFFTTIRYRIVEPFAALRARQAETLAEVAHRIAWSDSIVSLALFGGIYFCNELFDALPAHLLVSNGSGWLEKRVGMRGDEFVFINAPIADAPLAEHARSLPVRSVGYETEVNLAAPILIEEVAHKMERGVALLTDYGFARAEYYADDRNTGTLQCRAGHRLVDSPLERIGDCDITTHVEWTSLAQRAGIGGLQLVGLVDQHHFLTGILRGFPDALASLSEKERRGLQTLLHPEMLGRSFQVMALSRSMDPGSLSGFHFARDAAGALGL